jgi:hypothetical protein
MLTKEERKVVCSLAQRADVSDASEAISIFVQGLVARLEKDHKHDGMRVLGDFVTDVYFGMNNVARGVLSILIKAIVAEKQKDSEK